VAVGSDGLVLGCSLLARGSHLIADKVRANQRGAAACGA